MFFPHFLSVWKCITDDPWGMFLADPTIGENIPAVLSINLDSPIVNHILGLMYE